MPSIRVPSCPRPITALLVAFTAAACGGGSGGGGGAPGPTTFTIAGTVSGATVAGVTISLTGDAALVTSTDAGGAFSFAGLAAGDYVLTPARAGYSFTPRMDPVLAVSADARGRSFTAAAAPSSHAISGTVSGATAGGVSVYLSGAAVSQVATDGGGAYTFTGLANGVYAVTPVKKGFTFSPASVAVDLAGADAAGRDVSAAAAPAYSPSLLAGTWWDGSIASGPASPWWARGLLAVNAAGAVSGTLDFSDGTSEVLSGATMALSAEDRWALNLNATSQGALDVLGRVIAFTASFHDATPPSTELGLALKLGASYSTADLAGRWAVFGLATGAAERWHRADATIWADGTFVETVTASDAVGSVTDGGTLYLSPSGVMTISGDQSTRGALDALKTAIVMTSGTSPGTTELRVAVKRAASYTLADLAGTWRAYSLASGAGAPWWERAEAVIDAAGKVAITGTDSDGWSGSMTRTFAISPAGDVTIPGRTTVGTLDAAKSVIVMVDTWPGDGTPELKVVVRIR